MFSKFQTVDLGAIKPQGWVKDFLLTQANGITDKLAHTGYKIPRAVNAGFSEKAKNAFFGNK